MQVLSLFDGISCGQQALNNLNINHSYSASEIDPLAIKITQKHFSQTKQLGDVQTIHPQKVDLLIAGSPCQGFSRQGYLEKFDDPRSRLFWHFVRILKITRPKYFFLENVPMDELSEKLITETLKTQPRKLCSSLVSAQHRKRLYWTNIPFSQPKPCGKTFLDVIEHPTLLHGDPEPILKQVGKVKVGGFQSANRIYSPYGLCPTLTCTDDTIKIQRHRADKLPVDTLYQGVGFSRLKYEQLAIGQTLLWEDNQNVHYRTLSPLEAERLQTLPDQYTKDLPTYLRFKAIGNGWTVKLIEQFFKNIRK